MTSQAPNVDAIDNHVFHCRQYMENALDAINADELSKAGEMVWGSVAQALHAVAAWRGTAIDSHRDLMNFSGVLSREINDPAFPNIIGSARRLHDSFYVPDLGRQEIDQVLPGIRRAISQVLALLPDEVRNGFSTE